MDLEKFLIGKYNIVEVAVKKIKMILRNFIIMGEDFEFRQNGVGGSLGIGYGDGSGSTPGSYEWDCVDGSGIDRFDGSGSGCGDGEGIGFGSSEGISTNSGSGCIVDWEIWKF